ncbi:hypothetical protein F5Y17DRAFT_444172 [Xylariaceae sp. FL0594]|nr:hypothetical protein F5Y17DRAFT_444172 [Xylariaceae sp. FL0594]
MTDVFQGYHALQWYCDARTSSPVMHSMLIKLGIDVDAVDQRADPHSLSSHPCGCRGPAIVVRRTALGCACRNANVKAVSTLLQHGAEARGIAPVMKKQQTRRGKGGQHRLRRGERRNAAQDETQAVYPSPLQELLSQEMHGPHPGKHVWKYHLSESDEERDAYLDEDEYGDGLPMLRSLMSSHSYSHDGKVPASSSSYSITNAFSNPGRNRNLKNSMTSSQVQQRKDHDGTWCAECATDYRIWEPWPESEFEEALARERRRARYFAQVERTGRRMHRCAQLLVDYHCPLPPTPLSEGDDEDYDDDSAFDCFLKTVWRFLGPLAVCWRETTASREGGGGAGLGAHDTALDRIMNLPSTATFPPFGDLCDLLLESAGYAEKGSVASLLLAQGRMTRGWERPVMLIAQHPGPWRPLSKVSSSISMGS